MKVEVGKKAVLISAPLGSCMRTGQTVTVERIYQEGDIYFASIRRGEYSDTVYLRRLRPFTPLDEAME